LTPDLEKDKVVIEQSPDPAKLDKDIAIPIAQPLYAGTLAEEITPPD